LGNSSIQTYWGFSVVFTTPTRRATAILLVLFASLLPVAALTPFGPTNATPVTMQQPRIAAQSPHTTPFLPRVATATPMGISGFTAYPASGPQISVTFWKGTRLNTSFTNVTAGIDKTGRPFITHDSSGEPQVTVLYGTGTAVVFGTVHGKPFQKSEPVPFLTGTSAYGPFVITFLMTDDGLWLEPRFNLQNQEGCTNGSPLKPVHGSVSYGNPYTELANFGPFGPQVYMGSRGYVMTSLGFSTDAPYSPYGDVMRVSSDYATRISSALHRRP